MNELEYTRLEREDDAFDYLVRLKQFTHEFRMSRDNLSVWKWIIISLYGALYSYAILAVRGTDDSSVTNDKYKLLPLEILLEKLNNLTEKEKHYTKYLEQGFEPLYSVMSTSSMSYPLNDLCEMATSILDIIEKTVPEVFRWDNEKIPKETQKILNELKETFTTQIH